MRILRVAACVVVALSASACKARAALDIEIRRDGSGVLEFHADLDQAAQEAAGAPIEPVTAPFRDLAELESFFESPRSPDLVRFEHDGSRLDLTIDLPRIMHESLGDAGSVLIDAPPAGSANLPSGPSRSDFDATLSIRAEGSVRHHNADARRAGALVWRLWPIPDQPAVVSIDLGGSPTSEPTLLSGAVGATGAAALAAFLAHARFRRQRGRWAGPSSSSHCPRQAPLA